MKTVESLSSVKSKTERRYDLDWLRVLAVLLLVYFHAAAIFYVGDLRIGEYYIKNDRSSPVLGAFIAFLHQWHMPLFFLVSGAATSFSLSFRTASKFVIERFKRLLIPFLFCILVLVPPLVYYQLLSKANYQESYLHFYPQFFNGIRPQGNFEWAHLWFVIYLLFFSIIALPLFLYLRKQAGQHLVSKLARFLQRDGAIFLLALPLAVIEGALRPRWPGYQNLYDDWANFFLYLFYFIYGYIICSDTKITQAINRHFKIALIMAIASMSLLFGLWEADIVPKVGYYWGYILYQMFRGFNTWCWVVAILALAQRYLNFNNRVLQYTSEASYPFYILHQTLVVIIGFYVVRWRIGVMEKFFVITTASLVTMIVVYDIFVKRTNVTRFLFGMKPK